MITSPMTFPAKASVSDAEHGRRRRGGIWLKCEITPELRSAYDPLRTLQTYTRHSGRTVLRLLAIESLKERLS